LPIFAGKNQLFRNLAALSIDREASSRRTYQNTVFFAKKYGISFISPEIEFGIQ